PVSPTVHRPTPVPLSAAPTTELHPLSLHDALPIWSRRSTKSLRCSAVWRRFATRRPRRSPLASTGRGGGSSGRDSSPERSCRERSEEHTSELQSRENLVCRLLLEKKKPQENSTKRP